MQPESTDRKSRIDSVARITQITTSISIIVGIVAALVGLYDTKRQADLSFGAMRMTQLEPLREMIQKERAIERNDIGPFLEKFKACSDSSDAGQSASGDATIPCTDRKTQCHGMLDDDGKLLPAADLLQMEEFGWRGSKVYGHACFDQFKQIGRHYDELGALVRLGYVDFEFLFTLISFPDDFWKQTREYRGAIQANWGGKGVPLDDFWINFTWLRDKYQEARRSQQ